MLVATDVAARRLRIDGVTHIQLLTFQMTRRTMSTGSAGRQGMEKQQGLQPRVRGPCPEPADEKYIVQVRERVDRGLRACEGHHEYREGGNPLRKSPHGHGHRIPASFPAHREAPQGKKGHPHTWKGRAGCWRDTNQPARQQTRAPNPSREASATCPCEKRNHASAAIRQGQQAPEACWGA